MRKVIVVPISVLLGLIAVLAIARIFGSSRDDAATYTRFSVNHLAQKIAIFRKDNGRLPRSLAELAAPSAGSGTLGPYANVRELEDRWRRPLYFRHVSGHCGYVLFSLGADGRIGGYGQDRDIASSCPEDGS